MLLCYTVLEIQLLAQDKTAKAAIATLAIRTLPPFLYFLANVLPIAVELYRYLSAKPLNQAACYSRKRRHLTALKQSEARIVASVLVTATAAASSKVQNKPKKCDFQHSYLTS